MTHPFYVIQYTKYFNGLPVRDEKEYYWIKIKTH